jgi:hypothetical protein
MQIAIMQLFTNCLCGLWEQLPAIVFAAIPIVLPVGIVISK